MAKGLVALQYHDATKHSEISLRTSAHYLDWDNKPSPFKLYKNLESIPLPREFPQPKEPALDAIRGKDNSKPSNSIDIKRLDEILFFGAGLTRKMKFGSETYYMRTASATGALYPIELYVINNSIDHLAPGVYHFNPLEFALVQIRNGDYSRFLAEATDEETPSEAVVAMTSIAWRNAWKYEARSYRHWFWDSGVIAANLLAACRSERIAVRLLMGFVDSEVDKLLGLESRKEATVGLASFGGSSRTRHDSDPQQVRTLSLETQQLSKEEVDYSIIWETNSASALSSRAEVRTWHQGVDSDNSTGEQQFDGSRSQQWHEESPPLAQVILRRGSTRKFAQKPISLKVLKTILEASTWPVSLDFLSENDSLIDFYMIVNDVESLEPGSYYYEEGTGSLELLKRGKLRSFPDIFA